MPVSRRALALLCLALAASAGICPASPARAQGAFAAQVAKPVSLPDISIGSPKAGQIIRDAVQADILDPVSQELVGQDTEMRAAMALAVLMGMGIMHNMLSIDTLECSPEEDARFEKRLTRIFAAALEPMDD